MSGISCCQNGDACKVGVGVFIVVGVVALAVCTLALLIILGNHIDASISSKLYTNVSLLKPNVISNLWATAKWSGVVVGASAGMAILSAGAACCLDPRR